MSEANKNVIIMIKRERNPPIFVVIDYFPRTLNYGVCLPNISMFLRNMKPL